MRKKQLITAGFVLLALAACNKDDDDKPSGPQTFYGASKALGKGQIRAFVTLNAQGQPSDIGVRFTESTLNDLPTDTGGMHDHDMIDVPMPDQAKVTGIDHIQVNWNPKGHDPYEIYGKPHFDFHFYLVSAQEQASVVPGPDNTPVAGEHVPQDYITGVVAVPNMGVHWVDPKGPEFNGQPFTETFIYGFYKGKMTFLEPMITKAFLETHPDHTMPVKQPQSFQKSGYYPVSEQIRYDDAQHEFVVALTGLTKH